MIKIRRLNKLLNRFPSKRKLRAIKFLVRGESESFVEKTRDHLRQYKNSLGYQIFWFKKRFFSILNSEL